MAEISFMSMFSLRFHAREISAHPLRGSKIVTGNFSIMLFPADPVLIDVVILNYQEAVKHDADRRPSEEDQSFGEIDRIFGRMT